MADQQQEISINEKSTTKTSGEKENPAPPLKKQKTDEKENLTDEKENENANSIDEIRNADNAGNGNDENPTDENGIGNVETKTKSKSTKKSDKEDNDKPFIESIPEEQWNHLKRFFHLSESAR